MRANNSVGRYAKAGQQPHSRAVPLVPRNWALGDEIVSAISAERNGREGDENA